MANMVLAASIYGRLEIDSLITFVYLIGNQPCIIYASPWRHQPCSGPCTPKTPTTLALFHLVQIAMALRDPLLLMSSTDERPAIRSLYVGVFTRLYVCVCVCLVLI